MTTATGGKRWIYSYGDYGDIAITPFTIWSEDANFIVCMKQMRVINLGVIAPVTVMPWETVS